MDNVTTSLVVGGTSVSRSLKACSTSKILVGTLGRLMDIIRRGNFRKDCIKMTVVDEIGEILSS